MPRRSELIDLSQRRTIERRALLSPFTPRVKIWSPISPDEAFFDLEILDSSVVCIYESNIGRFKVPDTSVFGISDVYSDDPPRGFSGTHMPEISGGEGASFIVFKGSLLKPQNIDGQDFPAEMRYAMIQTQRNDSGVTDLRAQARRDINRFRNVVDRNSQNVLAG